jgi:hypothetical protein
VRRIIAQQPEAAAYLWWLRGDTLADSRQWVEAIACYTHSIEIRPTLTARDRSEIPPWTSRAVAELMIDRTDRYHEQCQEMLRRFDNRTEKWTFDHDLVARVSLLAPRADPLLARAADLGVYGLQRTPEEEPRLTAALARYRVARYQPALDQIRSAREIGTRYTGARAAVSQAQ